MLLHLEAFVNITHLSRWKTCQCVCCDDPLWMDIFPKKRAFPLCAARVWTHGNLHQQNLCIRSDLPINSILNEISNEQTNWINSNSKYLWFEFLCFKKNRFNICILSRSVCAFEIGFTVAKSRVLYQLLFLEIKFKSIMRSA